MSFNAEHYGFTQEQWDKLTPEARERLTGVAEPLLKPLREIAPKQPKKKPWWHRKS